jgi:tight adherence protein B
VKGVDLRVLLKLDSLAGLRWGSAALVTLGLTLLAWSQVSDETSFCYRHYFRYVSYLARKLRAMFIFSPPEMIPLGQAAAAYALTMIWLVVQEPLLAFGYPFIAIGPAFYIERRRRQRLAALEEQLDTFILALANALKTTPSIGAGLSSVIAVLDEPVKSEIDLCVKEMKVGSTLEQSLMHMAARVGSRMLDSALSSVMIGRQVGGNLPKLLETTAGTLREMRRLEGVVRTKTSTARAQLWLIGAMPFVLVILLHMTNPGYFDPLVASYAGYIVIALVAGLWLVAIISARKILAVDI